MVSTVGGLEEDGDDDDDENDFWYSDKARLGLFTLLCMSNDIIIIVKLLLISTSMRSVLRFWFFRMKPGAE